MYVLVDGLDMVNRFVFYKSIGGVFMFYFFDEDDLNDVFLLGVNLIFDGVIFELLYVDWCF